MDRPTPGRARQQVESGEAGQRTLAFFADRVEGNLLAAHQEIVKLGLLHPPGTLTIEQIEEAVVDVARFNVFKLSEVVLSGQIDRTLRMIDGLQAEGEAAAGALGPGRRYFGLHRARQAWTAANPADESCEQRVWGPRERFYERILPRTKAASWCVWSLPPARLTASSKACVIPNGRKTRGKPCAAWPCSWPTSPKDKNRPAREQAHEIGPIPAFMPQVPASRVRYLCRYPKDLHERLDSKAGYGRRR